jgi:hypothetical protein
VSGIARRSRDGRRTAAKDGDVRWVPGEAAFTGLARVEPGPRIDYAASAMRGPDDIESYLLKIGIPFEPIGPGMWNIKAEHENLVVSIAGPVVVFRTKVMDVPDQNRERLYEALLRLNTTDLVHGAFGIEDNSVVIVNALEMENLDFNEFSAVVDDFSMAVSKHYPTLSKFRPAA